MGSVLLYEAIQQKKKYFPLISITPTQHTSLKNLKVSDEIIKLILGNCFRISCFSKIFKSHDLEKFKEH